MNRAPDQDRGRGTVDRDQWSARAGHRTPALRWHVAARCNQRCAFCSTPPGLPETGEELPRPSARAAAAPAGDANGVRPSTPEARATPEPAGERRIVITGGEPTLRDDLPALIAAARAAGARTVELETNGVRAGQPGYARALRAAGLTHALVSLHAHHAEASDALTQVRGSFRHTVRGLRALQAAGVETRVIAVLTRDNVATLTELTAFVQRVLGAAGMVVTLLETGPAELRPELPAALAAIRRAAVVAREREFPFSVRHVPPCVLPGHEEIAELWYEPADGLPAAACATCRFSGPCGGFPRVFLDHGGPEAAAGGEARAPAVAVRQIPEVVRLTGWCNEDCSFCNVLDADTAAPEQVLSARPAQQAIVRIAAAGGTYVSFSGGEPTLSPDLPGLIAWARALGLREVEIQTNALRCADGDYVRTLTDSGLTRAYVSLHAHRAELSDFLTRRPGAFAQTCAGLRVLLGAGLRYVNLSHVITAQTWRYLPDFARFVRREFPTVSEVNFYLMNPIRQAEKNPWINARISQLRPFLVEAAGLLRDQGTPVNNPYSYPLCMLPGFEQQSAEWHLLRRAEQQGTGYDHAVEIVRRGKVQLPQCRRCRYEHTCMGVWKGYVALFGDDGIVPFEREQVPWHGRPTRADPAPPAGETPAPRISARARGASALPIVVFGAGGMGRRLLDAAAGVPGLEVVGVVTRTAASAAAVQAERGLPAATTLAQLRPTRAPRAALIATPTESHEALALECLSRGWDLLIEKPLAHDAPAAGRLAAEAARAGRTLLVDHSLLFHPGVLKALTLVRRGALGALRGVRYLRRGPDERLAPIRPQRIPPRPKGAPADPARQDELFQLALHGVALVRKFLGGDPELVVTAGLDRSPGEERLLTHWRGGSGVAAGVDLDRRREWEWEHRLEIAGARGVLTWTLRPDGEQLMLREEAGAAALRSAPPRPGDGVTVTSGRPTSGFGLRASDHGGSIPTLKPEAWSLPPDTGHRRGAAERRVAFPPGSPWAALLSAFCEFVTTGSSPFESGADGAAALRLTERCLRAHDVPEARPTARCVLVNTPRFRTPDDALAFPSLACARLTAWLRAHGYEAATCDLDIMALTERLPLPAFADDARVERFLKGTADPELARAVAVLLGWLPQPLPEVVGFSITDYYQRFQTNVALALTPSLKQQGVMVVLGGVGDELDRSMALGTPNRPDAICDGDGEAGLLALMEARSFGTRRPEWFPNFHHRANAPRVAVAKQARVRLNDLPVPSFGDLPLARYRRGYSPRMRWLLEQRFPGRRFDETAAYFPYQIVRGCAYKCGFCSYGAYLDMQDPAKSVAELARVVEETGFRNVFFLDTTVNMSPDFLDRFLDVLIARDLDLRWTDSCRPDMIDDRRAAKMRAAGCVLLNFGLDSGSDDVLKTMRKGFTARRAEQALQATARAGILNRVNLIAGYFRERDEDVARTADFLHRNRAAIHFTGCFNGFYLLEGMDVDQERVGVRLLDGWDTVHTGQRTRMYDEIGGLAWPEKRAQIERSWHALRAALRAADVSLASALDEYDLFLLARRFDDPDLVRRLLRETVIAELASHDQGPGAKRAGSVSDGPPAPGQGEAVSGFGLRASGFGLRASDQAGGTPAPGSSPGQALKPEARSLKPEIAPPSRIPSALSPHASGPHTGTAAARAAHAIAAFAAGDAAGFDRAAWESLGLSAPAGPPPPLPDGAPDDAARAAAGGDLALLDFAAATGFDMEEELAFHLGLKPVLYLVVEERDLPRYRRRYRDGRVVARAVELRIEEVRDIRHRAPVAAAPGGRWTVTSGRPAPDAGRRTPDTGHRCWDLFIARDAALAEEARACYDSPALADSVHRMGELLGYPECCRQAFAALPDRGDNSALRCRTAAATRGPFHWALNNTLLNLVPFYPCRYGCEAARDFALAVFEGVAARAPDYARRLRAVLARPVLFFDVQRFLLLDGAAWDEEEGLSYAEVQFPMRGPHLAGEVTRAGYALQQHFARGVLARFRAANRLRRRDGALELDRDGRVVGKFATLGEAGVLLPFGLDQGGA